MFGKNKKKKKSFGIFSGINSLKSSFKITKELISESKNSLEKEKVKETFEEALFRFNVNEENKSDFLKNKHNDIRKNSYINYFFGILFLIIMLIKFISGMAIIFILIMSILSLYFFLSGMTSAFRCYQIEQEKLGMLNEFFKKPKKWIPRKYNKDLK